MKPAAKAPAQVAVKRGTTMSFGEKMDRLLDRVRRRAYELFEQRGRENGHDLDDWLQAENELGILAPANIDEREGEIRLRIDGTDFSGDELKVYAEPHAITVEAASTRTTRSDGVEQSIERELFGRYELPAAINTELVKATFQNGVLEIVAPKTEVRVQVAQETGDATSGKPISEREKLAVA